MMHEYHVALTRAIRKYVCSKYRSNDRQWWQANPRV